VCPRSDLLWKEIGVAKLGKSRVKRDPFLGKKSGPAGSVLLIGEKMSCFLMHGKNYVLPKIGNNVSLWSLQLWKESYVDVARCCPSRAWVQVWQKIISIPHDLCCRLYSFLFGISALLIWKDPRHSLTASQG
jgi:hypothetical protein